MLVVVADTNYVSVQDSDNVHTHTACGIISDGFWYHLYKHKTSLNTQILSVKEVYV